MSTTSLLYPWRQALIFDKGRILPPSASSPPQIPHTQLKSLSPAKKPARTTASAYFHRHRRFVPRCSTGDAAVGGGAEAEGERNPTNSTPEGQKKGFFSKWKMDTAEMSSRLAKLGLAAVLAYGLFDGVTYTTFFVLAFLGYEKSTGKNPAANLQALVGIVILMWTGNNVTRPFRVAGAAALAPVVDKGLKKIQKYFNFPRQVYAFALVVSIVSASCLTVVGLFILSRWGK